MPAYHIGRKGDAMLAVRDDFVFQRSMEHLAIVQTIGVPLFLNISAEAQYHRLGFTDFEQLREDILEIGHPNL